MRLEMVERDGALSIRRQCALLGISRSSVSVTTEVVEHVEER